MPLYEYTCQSCGHDFEFLSNSAGDDPAACPACAATTLEKRFSAFAVNAKGRSAPEGPCASCSERGCPYAQG